MLQAVWLSSADGVKKSYLIQCLSKSFSLHVQNRYFMPLSEMRYEEWMDFWSDPDLVSYEVIEAFNHIGNLSVFLILTQLLFFLAWLKFKIIFTMVFYSEN